MISQKTAEKSIFLNVSSPSLFLTDSTHDCVNIAHLFGFIFLIG